MFDVTKTKVYQTMDSLKQPIAHPHGWVMYCLLYAIWRKWPYYKEVYMVTSLNGNIFRVTDPFWGESIGHQWFPSQRPVTRSFNVFFDLHLDTRLCKQSRRRWFETPSRSLWRHSNKFHPLQYGNPLDTVISWWQGYPKEKFLFITFEQLKSDPTACVKSISDFIGIGLADNVIKVRNPSGHATQ